LKMRKVAIGLGQLAVLFIMVYYLVYKNLILNWQTLSSQQWDFRWFPFTASLLAMSLTFAANSQIWRLVIHSLSGTSLRPYRALYIWFVSNLGRYLPGKMWQIAGMAMMARIEGIPALEAAFSSVLSNVICLLAGAAVGLVFLPADLAGKYGSLLIWARLGLPVILAFLYPPFLNRLLAWVSLLTGKPLASRPLRLRDLLLFFALNLVVWLVYGLCFHYFILSVVPEAKLSLSDSIGVYAVGYIIAFLAVFAPGGIVVRELLFTGLLSGSLGVMSATVVALVSRIWLTLAEMVPLVIMLSISGLPGNLSRSLPEGMDR
jgi:hypothetical protein